MTAELARAVPAAVENDQSNVIELPTGQPRVFHCQSMSAAVDGCLRDYFKSLRGVCPPPDLYEQVIHQVERPLIEEVLKYARGNQLRAAEILGINRNTLRKKIKYLEINPKQIA